MLVGIGLLAGLNGAWADTYEILYGTPSYDSDGTTVLSVATQGDFTGDTNEETGVSFSDANGTKCAEAMPIDGSVLFANTSSSWTKEFTSPVTEGKVYFAGNYSISANNSKTFSIVDSEGTVIFASANNNTRNNATLVVATICGTEISNYVRQPRSCAYGVKSLCIDLDAKTVTYDLLVSSGSNSYAELNGTVNLPSTVTDVKGLSVQKTSYGCYLDNVMLYSQISEATKYEYSINYKLNDNTVKTSSGKAEAGTTVNAESIVYASSG